MLALGGGAGVLGAVLLASPAGAATFTVANTDNNGIGSLSQAIIDANAAAGADTIEFAPGVTGMINLITDLPDITDSLTIRGPGSAALTIAGNELYHAFTIATAGSGGVTISGLTVDSSDTRNTGEASGGAIAVTDTALTLDDVTLTNNQARPTSAQAFGGGLGVNNEPGTGDVVITNSVMTNNVAVSTPGGGPDGEPIGGGGAWITADNITVTNSTFSENQADVGAGIFALARESLTLTSLTVSNKAHTSLRSAGKTPARSVSPTLEFPTTRQPLSAAHSSLDLWRISTHRLIESPSQATSPPTRPTHRVSTLRLEASCYSGRRKFLTRPFPTTPAQA